ncbi:MAG: hypothetical protein H0W06_09265 [Chloroflexia bacterium]|nr:hypothetical protein [Chloroflexia bacterium]
MSTLAFAAPLHASPLAGDFHWEVQLLVLLVIAGVWLFLAGHGERRSRRHAEQSGCVDGANGRR